MLWAACIGGAIQHDDHLDMVRATEFDVDAIRDNDGYRFLSDRAVRTTASYGVSSISLRAIRRSRGSSVGECPCRRVHAP
jgi:hypothetical protein